MNHTMQLLLAALIPIVAMATLLYRPGPDLRHRFELALAGFWSEIGEVRTIEGELTDLKTERSKKLTVMDEIVKAAKEDEENPNRALTEDEMTRYTEARDRVTEIDNRLTELNTEVRSEELVGGHQRFMERGVPNVNLITDPPATESRSLDELYWATADKVPAGSFTRNGAFIESRGVLNDVEQVVVRDDDEQLVVAPRISDFKAEHRAKIRQLQRTISDAILVGMAVDRSARSSKDGYRAAREIKSIRARIDHAMRALDVDTSGEGADWVPTGIGADVHEKVRAAGRVAPLFARIDMPTNPWKWPLEGADATAYRVPEPTSDSATKVTASTPGTGGATFDAEIFGGRILLSRSLEPDSAVAVLPYLRNKLVRAFVDAEEKAIIDGDTDGTHQDSDVGASTTDARTAWDGLRKRGLANASVDGANAVATLTLFRSARKLMLKWGLNPAELACILSIGAYYDLLDTTEVVTVDKMGAQATVLNGQLGALDGIPLIVSEHFREDLNASGVHDGVTTDRTGLVIVNRGEWAVGQRMALDVEIDDSIYRESFQRVLVGFMREDFQNIGDASSNDDTAYLYNLA